jgi:hypothetical protein
MRQLCGAVDDEVAGDVRGGVEDTAASTCTPLALGILRVFFFLMEQEGQCVRASVVPTAYRTGTLIKTTTKRF